MVGTAGDAVASRRTLAKVRPGVKTLTPNAVPLSLSEPISGAALESADTMVFERRATARDNCATVPDTPPFEARRLATVWTMWSTIN